MISPDAVKEFLRIDGNAEDSYLNVLILLAREIAENYMRNPIPDPPPESVTQAMLITIGYFYENRDGTKAGLPPAVRALLDPYRKAVF